MSLAPNEDWVEVGDGVLMAHLDPAKAPSDAKVLLDRLEECDMIEINLLYPEDFPVAVDTGVEPRVIKQSNRDYATLRVQVSELHRFAKMTQMRCDCHDEINGQYYIMELSIRNEAPHRASLKLKTCEPISNFGIKKDDFESKMEAAFREVRKILMPPTK